MKKTTCGGGGTKTVPLQFRLLNFKAMDKLVALGYQVAMEQLAKDKFKM